MSLGRLSSQRRCSTLQVGARRDPLSPLSASLCLKRRGARSQPSLLLVRRNRASSLGRRSTAGAATSQAVALLVSGLPAQAASQLRHHPRAGPQPALLSLRLEPRLDDCRWLRAAVEPVAHVRLEVHRAVGQRRSELLGRRTPQLQQDGVRLLDRGAQLCRPQRTRLGCKALLAALRLAAPPLGRRRPASSGRPARPPGRVASAALPRRRLGYPRAADWPHELRRHDRVHLSGRLCRRDGVAGAQLPEVSGDRLHGGLGLLHATSQPRRRLVKEPPLSQPGVEGEQLVDGALAGLLCLREAVRRLDARRLLAARLHLNLLPVRVDDGARLLLGRHAPQRSQVVAQRLLLGQQRVAPLSLHPLRLSQLLQRAARLARICCDLARPRGAGEGRQPRPRHLVQSGPAPLARRRRPLRTHRTLLLRAAAIAKLGARALARLHARLEGSLVARVARSLLLQPLAHCPYAVQRNLLRLLGKVQLSLQHRARVLRLDELHLELLQAYLARRLVALQPPEQVVEHRSRLRRLCALRVSLGEATLGLRTAQLQRRAGWTVLRVVAQGRESVIQPAQLRLPLVCRLNTLGQPPACPHERIVEHRLQFGRERLPEAIATSGRNNPVLVFCGFAR
mmetsp:Transcript_18552/g.54506  ORF Transcript_18552/g.54506 Transcript_18552/m.54506 type:complete len:623 (+) Transcript_18552:88-1956(+)